MKKSLSKVGFKRGMAFPELNDIFKTIEKLLGPDGLYLGLANWDQIAHILGFVGLIQSSL